jgi:polysaccharide biosynthesis protein VpsM
LDYVRGHDPRGSTDRDIQAEPDRYRLVAPGVLVAYGTPGASGRVELYVNDASRRYRNNRATTAFSDRDVTEFGGAFYWRVAPRTYAVVEARKTELDYKSSLSPLSGEERRIFGGVIWEATAATTGTVKIGRLQKRFDNTFPESKHTSWEALVTWAPRTYSKFDLYTGRYPTESTGLGSYILTDASGVVWNHAWSSYLNTEVNLRFQRDEYQGFNRSDDIRSIGLRAGYKFRRWLTLGAEYTYTQRDSNISVFEYDRNLYLLTATLSM